MDKQYKAVLQQLRTVRSALAVAGERAKPALVKEEGRLALELRRLATGERAPQCRREACGKRLLPLLDNGRPTSMYVVRKAVAAAGFSSQELSDAVSDLVRERRLINLWGRGLVLVP